MASRIAIVGPGALGLALAGSLRAGGADAFVLDRDPERASRLNRDGIVRRRARSTDTVRVPVTADPASLAGASLVLVCVKAGSDESVARLLERAPGDARILTLGNGLGRTEAFLRLGAERVLQGSITVGANLAREGEVVLASEPGDAGALKIAPIVPAGAPGAEEAARLLAGHGMSPIVSNDPRRIEWEKALVNAAINALCGLFDCSNGALLESPSARDLASRAAIEAARTARALEVSGDWTDETAVARWEAVSRATRGNFCSTVQDLRHRRKSEVHAINGAIARAAKKAGIEAPLNEILAALVAAREELNVTP